MSSCNVHVSCIDQENQALESDLARMELRNDEVKMLATVGKEIPQV